MTKNKLLLRSNKRATFYAFLRERDLLLMTTYYTNVLFKMQLIYGIK